jgi:hypothetical protein
MRRPVAAELILHDPWRWGSLWRRTGGNAQQEALLSDGPVDLPSEWLRLVNQPQTDEDLATCV